MNWLKSMFRKCSVCCLTIPFHPIEKVSVLIKTYMARNNKRFNLGYIEKLIHKGIREITPQRWADLVRYTEKELCDVWKNEGIPDECIEQMMISVTSISNESGAKSQEEYDDKGFTSEMC